MDLRGYRRDNIATYDRLRNPYGMEISMAEPMSTATKLNYQLIERRERRKTHLFMI